MNFKRQLHTLHVKHDSQFRSLSKIALAQLILKIVHLKHNGALIKQIRAELDTVIVGNVSHNEINDAINYLKKEEKIRVQNGRHFISEKYRKVLESAQKETEELHSRVLDKFFGKAESPRDAIRTWFQDTTIKFFETFSFEWFYQVAYRKRQASVNAPNIWDTLDEVLKNSKDINDADKDWLKKQYNKFIDSEDPRDNLLFWQYGISMFSSRLITARNYADQLSIEMFRDSKFILDTNILMILDLEEHELHNSLKTLEGVLESLNVEPVYFSHTRDEYLRAMNWRKNETIKIFQNYKLDVLKASDCPFIQTALKRQCKTEEDLIRMFDRLLDLPEYFHESLNVSKYEYQELNDAISEGENSEELKESINAVYYQRLKKDKRERPLIHDAGLISGALFLSKSEKCWVVTSDSTLKLYAIENVVRDKNEIAIGLDVIIGIMAINSGGINVEASNFAPLFKNIVKYTLIPESNAFELQDLAFILSSNTKVHELDDDQVIEAAKNVKKRRIAGDDDEAIALYLRRVIEGEKLRLMEDIEEVRERERITSGQKVKAEKEKGIFIETYRSKRKGELRDAYDKQLRINRLKLIVIPVLIGVIIFTTMKYWAIHIDGRYQFLVGCAAEAIFGLLPLIPFNQSITRRYSEYVSQIDAKIDQEITELLDQAKREI